MRSCAKHHITHVRQFSFPENYGHPPNLKIGSEREIPDCGRDYGECDNAAHGDSERGL